MLTSVDAILALVDIGLEEQKSPEMTTAVLAMLEKVARAMAKCRLMSEEKLFQFWQHVSG